MLFRISFFLLHFRSDKKEYALKLIEGTGISMSACREIAVCSCSTKNRKENQMKKIKKTINIKILNSDIQGSVVQKLGNMS